MELPRSEVPPPHPGCCRRRWPLPPPRGLNSLTATLLCRPLHSHPSMADVWGDGSSGDEREGLDREWRARREEHWSSGYREGVEAGKHETVQQGFNEGGWAGGYSLGGAAVGGVWWLLQLSVYSAHVLLQGACMRVADACTLCHPPAGYAQGAAAGYECGVARGAAATLRALADRLPADMAQQLQERGGPQQGGIGDVPYQQLQRQVCEGLAAAPTAGQPTGAQEGQQAAGVEHQAPPQRQPLPPAVRAALEASTSELEQLGLHVLLQSGPRNV